MHEVADAARLEGFRQTHDCRRQEGHALESQKHGEAVLFDDLELVQGEGGDRAGEE
jgi:hypothetical protein